MMSNKRTILLFSALIILVSCSTLKGPAYKAAKNDEAVFSTPIREPKVVANADTNFRKAENETKTDIIEVLEAPMLNVEEAAKQAEFSVMPKLTEKIVTRLSFHNMPVGTFINEVFGNQLALDYVLEPGIEDIKDLITMRFNSPVSEKALYKHAMRTLQAYGVTSSISDNVLFLSYSEEAAGNEVPLLISGRALPEVPSTSRPVFFVYPLKAVSPLMLRSWLKEMFPARELSISEDMLRNAILFRGPIRLVNQAVEATKLFDLPFMRGMHSRIFRPRLSTVTDLANNLQRVLEAQGYNVRQNPTGAAAIRLLPLETVNQLVVFTLSPEVLAHVIDWATTLENERYGQVEHGLFSYQVQSTSAVHIVKILNNLGVGSFSNPNEQKPGTGDEISRPRAQSTALMSRYAVDNQLNTILFNGSGKDWLKALPIIQSLDKPAPSVMVEVILAEVQLTDSEQSGIEWLGNSTADRFAVNFGTLSGLGTGSGGFRLTLDNAGQTRALLNFFYKNEKANIRSRPRLMVKSGGEASIDVGNEIPIITTNSQSIENPNAPIIQNVTYRKTGIILNIKPTVHASGFVEIEVRQELSEATATSSSNIDSPTILNRSLSTTVNLRDGGSVLIGGLISSTMSEGEQGVPILGRVPLVKELFSAGTNDQIRTELMVMIIPYILNSPDEAEALTDELQRVRIKSLSEGMMP